MKKLLYVFAAAAILLQACSTGKSFSKKRYSHLKWIDHNTEVVVPGKDNTPVTNPVKNTDKVEETTLVKKTEPVKETTIVLNATETTAPVVNTQKETTFQPMAKAVKTDAPAVTKEDNVNEVAENHMNNESLTLNKQVVGETLSAEAAKPMMDETAKLIICVILALFIPPLAMYLWDQQADIWFIVDLILFLSIFFLFFGYGFGLIGLLAVVIALLRIFELL